MGSPPLLQFCPQLVHDDEEEEEEEAQEKLSCRSFPSPVTKAENFQLVAVFHPSFILFLDLKSEGSCSDPTPFYI